jgi:hypothetical protein
MPDEIVCHSCGTKNAKHSYDCPICCKRCYTLICPECGGPLNNEETHIEYCGDGCSNCGWSHCGQCE